MNTQPALSVLARVETLIDQSHLPAESAGKGAFWQRDKSFISSFRDCLLSEEPERVRWAFDQMRNLSQGFGSYCHDMNQLDTLLDKFHQEMLQLVSTR